MKLLGLWAISCLLAIIAINTFGNAVLIAFLMVGLAMVVIMWTVKFISKYKSR